jgi:hypothetical protein
MAAAPEVTTTDVANFTAGTGTAVLQRHEFTDRIVRYDGWRDNSQIATARCDRPGDLLQHVTAARCSAAALSPARSGQR